MQNVNCVICSHYTFILFTCCTYKLYDFVVKLVKFFLSFLLPDFSLVNKDLYFLSLVGFSSKVSFNVQLYTKL